MKKRIPNWSPDQDCFFCGAENPIGLKLDFYLDEETKEVTTECVPSKLFTGFGNILHGGLQSGLFDEVMGWAAHILTGRIGVTSELKIKFLKPVYVEQKITASCRMVSRRGPKVELEARIENSDGVVCSRATSTYYLVPQDKFLKLIYGGEEA